MRHITRPAVYDAKTQERYWAKVDKSGDCWLWTAFINPAGYGTFRVGDAKQVAHRVSFQIANGPIPANLDLDHACHNRACVNPHHLRKATRKQNMENLAGPYRNSQSGVRGVSPYKGRWRAYVGHNGRIINCGHFATITEAESAVIAKRNELFQFNDGDRVA